MSATAVFGSVHVHGAVATVRPYLHGTVVPARPWSYTNGTVPWSYVNGMSSRRSSRSRAPTRRDQRPVHSNLRIRPTYSDSPVLRLGGMGISVRRRFAMRRRRRQRAQDLPARLKAGHCVCSHILSSNGLATSGYHHQACDVWPAPDSHLLSSRCLSWAGTCICVDSVNVDASTTLTSLGLRPVESRRRGRSRYGGVAGQGMEAWPVKARVSGNVSVRAAPAPKAIQNQTANDSHPCSKHGSSGCSGTVVWIPTRR